MTFERDELWDRDRTQAEVLGLAAAVAKLMQENAGLKKRLEALETWAVKPATPAEPQGV